VRGIFVKPNVQKYIVELVTETRKHSQIEVGASPRGSLALLHAAQARAAMNGRDYVDADDVQKLAPSVLAHRIVLTPETRAKGIEDTTVIEDLVARVPVPFTVE